MILLVLGLSVPAIAIPSENKSTDLQEEIAGILAQFQMPNDSISIDAVYVNSGHTLYQLNAEQDLIPASTMKLLTSITALENLGASHRYPTEIYTSPTENKKVLSNLWIKGYGSPFLVNEEMRVIAKALRNQGITKIDGPIYVDDTYFGAAHPIRFEGTSIKKMYRVVTGALSFNFNRPEALQSKARQYKKHRKKKKRSVYGIPGRSPLLSEKVIDPAIYTGMALRDTLKNYGITVTGPIEYRPVDPDAELLLFHASTTLAEILKALNKISNNFIAEQILRSMSAARYGIASRETGLELLTETLAKTGTASLPYTLNNASGLSRENRLSALQLTALLRHAISAPYGQAFLESLSIAGVDGTLRKRFRRSRLRGRVWAKTGSIHQVNALAGFALADKNPIVFAIIINEYNGSPEQAQKAEEKILEALVRRAKNGDFT